jgi:hypothetical protein
MGYNAKNYRKQGGKAQVVKSGGSITLESGAILEKARTFVFSAGFGKVGATAGFAIPSAHSGFTNSAIAGCPAGQTGATLVIPLGGFKSGDIITGFRVCGQVESAGNTASIAATLMKSTNVAAGDIAISTLGTITPISATADAVISSAVGDLSETVDVNASYYVLVTVTTAASTDVQISHVRLNVTEQ